VRWIYLLCIFFDVAISGVCAVSQAQSPGVLKETRVESYVASAFLRTKTSGSLILAGKCDQTFEGHVVSTEPIFAPSPDSFALIDSALNALSRVAPQLVWQKQTNGLIRVRDNRVEASLLTLRLRKIELKNMVDLNDAINKLLENRELRVYLHQKHVELATVYNESFVSNQITSGALSTSPDTKRLSRTLTNVTLADALDYIVRIFPGIWTYSECPGRITITADPTGFPHWEQSGRDVND
jgi:hypothetical protein